MENRETKTIKTPIGENEVVLKAWLTGRERREITNLFLDTAKVSEGKLGDFKLSAETVNKAQDLTFETVIVSVDGDDKDIVNKILDMRGEDFDFIVTEINKITGTEVEKEVKKD